MKRVITLLLALTMVCAFLPIMASAADVNYTYTLGTPIADDTTGDLAYPIIVTANGAAPAGGYITLAWDIEKVAPAICYESRRDGMVVDFALLPDDWADFAAAGDNIETIYAPDDSKSYLDTANNKLAATWFTSKATSDGETIATFYFILQSGVTTADFNADTFKVVTDSTWANCPATAKLDTKTDASYVGDAVDCIFNTYTKTEANEWEADDEATKADIDEILAGETYVRAVAVFGKNAAGAEYYVTFNNNTYKGVSEAGKAWAMVLYDDGSADHDLIGDVENYAYSVSATEGGEALWNGVATVYSAE